MASRHSVRAVRSTEILFDLTGLTDQNLVEKSKEGSHVAFSALIERHSRRALGTIRKIVRNHADAEDILQESVMKAYRHIASFDGRSSFSTWFTRIAINTALMLVRRRTARPEMSLEVEFCEGATSQYPIIDHAPNPEQSVMRRQSLDNVQTAIHRLPSSLRECVERKYFMEITNAEVANLLGISVAATKSRLLRARRQLRVSLTALHGNEPDASGAN
jgi:RNA polymerase sigma-70 factor, ECF subfamily